MNLLYREEGAFQQEDKTVAKVLAAMLGGSPRQKRRDKDTTEEVCPSQSKILALTKLIPVEMVRNNWILDIF